MLCIRNIIISERTNKNANLKKNVTLLLVDIEIESYSFLCTLPVHSCGIKLTTWMPVACNWYFNSITYALIVGYATSLPIRRLLTVLLTIKVIIVITS